MSELKPCPFCGGKALTNTFLDYEDLEYTPLDTIEHEVTCENERCINGWWLSPKEWNARPIEDALNKRIAELEAEVAELKPYRDGYDGYDDYPEEGETVIARLRNWVFLAQHRGDYWYDALGYKEKIRGEVERWWKLPEVQE